ncbi:MAG TPA: hypothetical protein VGJ91_17050, partial [Polyangiaceae bacterium]
MTTPITPVRNDASARPAPLRTYPSSATARTTRSRNSGRTDSGVLSARETEAVETPATSATSRAVATGRPLEAARFVRRARAVLLSGSVSTLVGKRLLQSFTGIDYRNRLPTRM